MPEILKKELTPKVKIFAFLAAVIFFACKAAEMIINVSYPLAYPAATLYLLDYNFYIGSRTFIGSVLTLLTPTVTYQQIFLMNLGAYIFAAILLIVMAAYLLRKSVKSNNDILFYLSILIIVAPYSMLGYSCWVCSYDIYLFIFAALCVLATLSKRTHWICPLLCFAGVFTHYAFVFSYFPALFSVQIYFILTEKKKTSKIIRSITAALTFAVSFASGVYCGFYADKTIKMSRDELFAYMEGRLGAPALNEPYIDSYYFNDDVYGMLKGFSESITTDRFNKNFACFFIPVIILIMLAWVYYITKPGIKQIISVTTAFGTLATSLALVFLIIEAPRWQTAATLSQVLLLFAANKRNDEDYGNALAKANTVPVKIIFIAVTAISIAANFIIKPYYTGGDIG